jgi:nitrous oxide reductase
MMNFTISYLVALVVKLSVYGLPSGRLLRVLPVFSVDPEKGWGYSEETKPMLNTSHGFVPWDDLHHIRTCLKQWYEQMVNGYL